MASYLTRNIYPGLSAGTHPFAISFPYLDVEHVHLYTRLNSAAPAVEQAIFSFTSGSIISFTVPAGVTIVEIWRKTPRDVLLERIGSPSTVTSEILNDMATQLLYIEQEVGDEQTDLSSRALLSPPTETAPAFPSLTGAIGKILAVASAGVLAFLTPAQAGFAKGDPGGNIMAVGPATSLPTLSIPIGSNRIRTADGADYVADAAVNSAFVAAHPGWSVLTTNGRGFRLDENQYLWFEMFGAVGDADPATGLGTDNSPAWGVARDFMHYFRNWPSGNYYYKATIPLNVRERAYYFSLAMDLLDAAYVIRGNGNGGYGLASTRFFFAAGQCGMILQSWDTTGTQGTHTNDNTQPYNHGASSALISDITVVSLGGTVGAFQHGYVLKCQAQFTRCWASNFGGDGFHIAADVNTAGNANSFKLVDCGAQFNGRSGLYLDGGDGNAGYSLGFQAFNNGTWGIYDSSFLGNHHFFFETDGNGTNTSGPSWAPSRPSTLTNLGGHTYRVRPGQEVAARTTTPGTNAGVWVDLGTSSSLASLGGSWVINQTFVSGGSYYADDASSRCVFAGYRETNQADPWLDSPNSCVLPGFSSPATGAFLQAQRNGLVAGRIGSIGTGATAGHTINATLGDSGDDGFFSLGNSTDGTTQNWRFKADNNDVISQVYAGAGGSSSFECYPPGQARVGFGCSRGIVISGAVALTAAAAMPTTGAYVIGDWVENSNPVIAAGKVLRGWKRLTTGSAHVAGTDWTPLYSTTT